MVFEKKNIQLLFSRKGLCVHAWCTQRWPHIRVIIGTASSAGREVGEPICPTHRLKQRGGAVAGRVAGGQENVATTVRAEGKTVQCSENKSYEGSYVMGIYAFQTQPQWELYKHIVTLLATCRVLIVIICL